jgi:hypothetical protein
MKVPQTLDGGELRRWVKAVEDGLYLH